MSKYNIPLYLCGGMILTSYFGEQFKIGSIPIYCIFIVAFFISWLLIRSRTLVIRNINFKSISQVSLLWIIVATIHFLFSFKVVGSQSYLYCVVTGLIVIVVSMCCKSKKDTELLLKYAYIGVLITCVACTIELITGVHYIPTNDYYSRMGNGNTFGFQINVNDNASLLSASLFVPLYFIKRKPVLNSILVVWILFLLVKIESRLGLISVFASALFAVGVYLFNFINKSGRQILGAIFTFTMLIVVFLLFAFLNEQIFLRYISDSINYTSDSQRIMIIKSALSNTEFLGFIFGNGAGVTQEVIGYSIHCLFIEVLCDYGVFVAVWLFSFIFRMFRAYRSNCSNLLKIYVVSFSMCFSLLSFCSSSMIRIRSIWAVFCLIWCSYQISCGDKNRYECI